MAQYLLPFLYLISSALATYFLLKLSIPIFKKILPAYPTSRGMHNMTKPTSGGILFALVYSLFALFKGFHLALLSMPIAIIGLIDDKYNISRKTRYLAQIINLILIIIYLSVNNVGIFQNSFNYNFWHYFFLVFFGTAIINFINFHSF